jgi:hypothetical protein
MKLYVDSQTGSGEGDGTGGWINNSEWTNTSLNVNIGGKLQAGEGSKATGSTSTAMGSGTTASGSTSTAIGHYTTASGIASTAMGWSTEASGEYSTAMGLSTTASGPDSTAIGSVTTASGGYSTAMGSYTEASGAYSTAMGRETTASGIVDTAMGSYTTASGWFSTAMGSSTTASGYVATAMGRSTIAYGEYSTAMGSGTTASGPASTAMGYNTTASGDYSTAMGYYTEASGDHATAMGSYTEASGSISTAMGWATKAQGSLSTAMGFYTTASGLFSTAMGSSTIASGVYSTAMGRSTIASGEYSTAMGREINVLGDYSFGIALNDQNGNNVTQDNTMAIMGGNVGIGTISPATKLEIQTGADDGLTLSDEGTGQTYAKLYSNSENRGYFELYQNDVKRILITSGEGTNSYFNGGNVGIGTTNPQAKLFVEAGTGGGTGALNNSIGNHFTLSGWAPTVYFEDDSAVQANAGIGVDNSKLHIGKANMSLDYNKLDQTSFVLDLNNKRVGIGTNNPSVELHVTGSGYFTSGLSVHYLFSSNDITAGRNLGLTSSGAFYFGNDKTDGTWRIIRSGDDLLFQRRESGNWVTKSTISA